MGPTRCRRFIRRRVWVWTRGSMERKNYIKQMYLRNQMLQLAVRLSFLSFLSSRRNQSRMWMLPMKMKTLVFYFWFWPMWTRCLVYSSVRIHRFWKSCDWIPRKLYVHTDRYVQGVNFVSWDVFIEECMSRDTYSLSHYWDSGLTVNILRMIRCWMLTRMKNQNRWMYYRNEYVMSIERKHQSERRLTSSFRIYRGRLSILW